MPANHLAAAFVCLPFAAAAAMSPQGPTSSNDAWFDAPVLLELGPHIDLLGDFDQDGDVDALALLASTVIPLQNDGRGHFTALTAQALGGVLPVPVLYADLDGDGVGELIARSIASSNGANGVRIWPGLVGGGFGAEVFLPLPGIPFQLQIGRGDGDQLPDLYVRRTSANGDVAHWLFGAPGLVFSAGPAVPATTSGERALVDVDGDGVDDVAWLSSGARGSTLFVERTTATGFAPWTSLPLPFSSSRPLLGVDLDGDGDEDLCTSEASGSTNSVVRVLHNDGAGGWTLASVTAPGIATGQLWSGDWDGDGTCDLLLQGGASGGGYRRLARFENDQHGNLALRATHTVEGASDSFGGGLADVDGDGALDFVGADFLLFGTGAPTPPVIATQNSVVLDWDDDGDADFLGAALLLNDGTGALHAEGIVLPDVGPAHGYGARHLLHDLDGDGHREMLVDLWQILPGSLFAGTRLLREAADLHFVDVGPACNPNAAFSGEVVLDADDDGDLDVIGSDGVWVNDGTGFFSLQGQGHAGWRPVGADDVDDDGDEDVLLQYTAGTGVALLRCVGPVNYEFELLYADAAAITSRVYATFADVDDDGDQDVIAYHSHDGNQTRVLVNEHGQLQLGPQLPYGGYHFVADIDGDGMSDLGVQADTLRIFRRIGPGANYAAPVAFATPTVLGAVDFDQDGDVDVYGAQIVHNTTCHGAAAGSRLQYGVGRAGTGGRRPIASVVGPVREGEAPRLRLRNAPAGTLAVLLVGTGAKDAPSVVLPGVQAYVEGLQLLLTYGTDNLGGVDVAVPIQKGFAGIQLNFEWLVLDAAVPGILNYSNGAELHVGK